MSSNNVDEVVVQTHDWFFKIIDEQNSTRCMITDKVLAEKAGISQSYYSQLKDGKRKLSIRSMIIIADAVGLKLEFTLKTKHDKKT